MPTPPGFADCSYELRQTGLTRPAYVTFGVDPVDTDPALVAGSLQAAFLSTGSFKSILDSSVTLSAIRVSLGTDGTADLVTVLNTSQVGGQVGGNTPPNVAVLVHKSTSRGGRRGRGRMYLPWCLQTSTVDEAGQIGASTLTALNAAMLAWKIALTAANTPMVLLHGPGRTGIPAPDPVLSLSCDRLIATQRRRLGR
jgi:hypothetical protein